MIRVRILMARETAGLALLPLGVLSILGWLGATTGTSTTAYCSSGTTALYFLAPPVPAVDGFTNIFFSSALMVLAMMSPMVAPQARHIWRSSLSSKRLQASLVFVCGYLTMWTVAAILLEMAVAYARQILGDTTAFTSTVAFALAWQGTRLRAILLSHSHKKPSLRIFGCAAVRGWVESSIRASVMCLGTCAPAMTVCLAPTGAHWPLMVLVTVLLLAERFGPVRRPRTSPGWVGAAIASAIVLPILATVSLPAGSIM
jgi:predicted metal-binding membrane protein